MTKPKDADGTIIQMANRQKEIELPIKTTTKILTQTEGRGLKQNARGSKGLVDAVMFGFPYVQRWHDDYVLKMLDDLMCLSISLDGKGRQEMIDCLSAGGQLPDAYYNSMSDNPRRGETSYIRYGEE